MVQYKMIRGSGEKNKMGPRQEVRIEQYVQEEDMSQVAFKLLTTEQSQEINFTSSSSNTSGSTHTPVHVKSKN